MTQLKIDIRPLPAGWKLAPLHRYLLWAVAALLVFLLAVLFFRESFDNALYNALFTLRGAIEDANNIVIIGIDDDSFQQLQIQWPWPRSLHAELVESLTRERARVVVFDVLFDTKSHNVNDDRLFSQAIQEHQKVILAATLVIQDQTNYTKKGWIDPFDSLSIDKSQIGGIDLPVDSDGHVRWVRPFYDGRPMPGFLAAQLYAGTSSHPLTKIPDKKLFLNYLGPHRSFANVSYYQALDPVKFLPPNTFKDKLVFIGSTSEMSSTPNLPDHFMTPFSKQGDPMSGVEIHATIAHNFLRQNFITTPNWPVKTVEGVLALLCSLTFFRTSPLRGVCILFSLTSISLLLCYMTFIHSLVFVPLGNCLIPCFFLLIAGISLYYYELFKSEQQSRKLLAESEERISQILRNQDIAETDRRIKVFISYKHKAEDAMYMAEILDFLQGLQKDGIDFWTDQSLRLGEKWDETIRQQLNSSDIALILISQAYLDSEYCMNTEIKLFLEREVTLMPIILSPCELERHAWLLERHAWLLERQYLPSSNETISEHYQDTGKRLRMFLEIRNELRKQAKKLLTKKNQG